MWWALILQTANNKLCESGWNSEIHIIQYTFAGVFNSRGVVYAVNTIISNYFCIFPIYCSHSAVMVLDHFATNL